MGKFKLKKYSLGIQEVSVPPELSGAQQFTNITSLASQGASLGMNFGPIGAAIGGGIGLVGGSILSGVQANKMREAHNKALLYNQSVNRDNFSLGGVEATQIKPMLYKQGTNELQNENKVIELERKELVFEKNEDNKYNLVLEVKGKTHNQGGEPYVAKRGQVIFPAKLYDEVLQAWKDRNHSKLETLRLSLPKDTNHTDNYFNDMNSEVSPTVTYNQVDKAKKGKRYVLPKYQNGTNSIGDPELLNSIPPEYARVNPNATGFYDSGNWAYKQDKNRRGYEFGDPDYIPYEMGLQSEPVRDYSRLTLPVVNNNSLQLPNTTNPNNLQQEQNPQDTLGNQILGVTGQAANIYNTVRGFMEKPVTTEPILPKLEQYQFRDRYNPQRRLVLENRYLNNSRLSQQGNASVVGANQAINNSNSYNQLNDINNEASNQAYQVDMNNLQLRNQYEQNKAQELRRVQDINYQNKAAQTRFQAAAVSGIGQDSYDQLANRQMMSRDVKMDNAQKNYIAQLAQRDSTSAKLQLFSNPASLQYFTEEEIQQIFGHDPQTTQDILTMKRNMNINQTPNFNIPR